jgi:hypothetical protein
MANSSSRQNAVANEGEASPPIASPPSLPPATYPAQIIPTVKCQVDVSGDHAYALVLIEPHILQRLRRRYPTNLDEHLWSDVFRPALETSVY